MRKILSAKKGGRLTVSREKSVKRAKGKELPDEKEKLVDFIKNVLNIAWGKKKGGETEVLA